ncbi:MAG: Spy/CpxP family protein refolding chaperone [Bacteroidetes bacterium]|nr:Spy/CpxP family protein refolding chaperone [Bacteroidota bacterium]
MTDQIKTQANVSTKKSFLNRTGVRITLAVFAVFFGIVLVKGIAFAKNIHKFHHDGPEGFIIDRISDELDLNADQKAQVERIKGEIRNKMESEKPDREAMLKEFSEEFTKDRLDKNKILEHIQKNETKRNEMKEFMIDKLVEFHSILTPQQRLKVIEKMKEMKNMFPPPPPGGPRGPGNFHQKND